MSNLPNRVIIDYKAGDPSGAYTAAMLAFYDAFLQTEGVQTATVLSIAAGVVTPIRASHMIDTEAAAAIDDLTHIDQTNLPDGFRIMIRSVDASRVPTVKHNQLGAGEILLVDGLDFALNAIDKFVILERRATAWVEIERHYGADKAAMRAHYGLAIGIDVLAPTGDASGLTGIIAGATTAEKANIALNAFRIAVNGGLSVQNMIDGVVDEFTDETGVDLVASLNETYDATGDYFHNPTPYTADQVPVMTGTSTPSGTVLFDSEQVGNEAWKAFDASTVTTWGSNAGIGSVNNAYIGYDFGLGITKTIRAFTHLDTGGVFHPASVLLQYSDDGITWTTQGIYALTNTVARETVPTTATTAHRYWRLKGNVTTTISGTNNWFANDVEFLELGLAPNMTLQSNAHAALVQPSSVFVVLWHETVDVVTLNTDLKVWVSRDGGMTWTQVVVTKVTGLSVTEQILSGSANISAQPAGVSLKWKIETLTNKEQRLRGVSEQWS